MHIQTIGMDRSSGSRASKTFHDIYGRDFGFFIQPTLPYIVGANISGIVEKLGLGEAKYSIGDHVFTIDQVTAVPVNALTTFWRSSIPISSHFLLPLSTTPPSYGFASQDIRDYIAGLNIEKFRA
jgi:NADPH:quinone reductase-like Zn-dependent oxidoreductase